MLHQLITAALLLLLLAVAEPAAWAQAPRRAPSGPRALAVVEMLSNKRARLVPVAIRVENRFYDANLYSAKPRPIAVDFDTLYDVLRTGEPVGTFTVGSASRVNGLWLAGGKFDPKKDESAPAEVRVGTSPATTGADDEDKPPILRKPGASSDPAARKEAPSASTPEPETAGKPAQEVATQSDMGNDPSRPTLRRGKPTDSSSEVLPFKDVPGLTVIETLTAISDATRTEYRPFTFEMKKEEQAKFAQEATGMALEAITRFASTHATSGVPATGPLADVSLRVFDLDLGNQPIIVLSGRKPALARGAKNTAPPDPNLDFYVTVVARTDIYGNMRRLFTHVTDKPHMDSLPKLELIDAVDAEGVGRGQLLFRQVFDGERSFILYRVGADKLWPLFEGAAGH